MKQAKHIPQPPRFNPELAQGLTGEQALARAQAGQSNIAPKALGKTYGQIVRDNLCTFFNLVFVLLGLCLALVGAYTEMLFLVIVVVNALIGIVQEIRVKRVLDRISLLSARTARVVRDGAWQELPTDELVLDDIVEFAAGDQICADAALRDGFLEVDESLLTGESDTVAKHPGDTLLSGSVVMAGKGIGQLTGVGADCYAATITGEARKGRHHRSGIMKSLDQWLKILGFIITPLALAMFWQSFVNPETSIRYAVSSTVAAVVGMIPEGLYLLVSAALAVSVITLSRKGTMVHELSCIENLARVDTLCIDKTGTITEGHMKVCALLPVGGRGEEALRQDLAAFVYAARDENATAAALLEYCPPPSSPWQVRGTIPFSSMRKWGAVLCEDGREYILGAPEMVLGPAIEGWRGLISGQAGAGRRVLALACGRGLTGGDRLLGTPDLLGFVALSDPVRADAAQTLSYFREQGVDIKVISGDSAATASSIARQAGIENSERCVDAVAVESGEELGRLAAQTTVFGRVSPQQKRDIIHGLKAAGRTVAMLGDGVNDVLALKDADCSIAMASGSDAAQQVSQLVLMHSDFSALPSIVREGRRVINNVNRSASLFLVKNIYSFVIALVMLFASESYPLLPLQVSLYSGLMIGMPSFLLTFEPVYGRVRGQFLLRAVLNALPGGLSAAVIVLAASALGAYMNLPQEQLSTVCLFLIGLAGVLVLLFLCWPLTRLRGALLAAVAVLFFLAVTILHGIFHVVPLGPSAIRLTLCLAAALPILMGALILLSGAVKRALTRKEA